MSIKKTGSKRTFSTIIYPEHFVDKQQLVDLIASKHIEAYLSPLHDKDVNADGTAKKAHYHLLVSFEGTRTEEYAKEFFSEFQGVGLEKVESKRGMARYLIHADNQEKYQYSKEDVQAFCGNYEQFFDTADDSKLLFFQIINYIDDNNVLFFNHLLRYCMEKRQDWFDILTGKKSQAVFMYLKSKKYEQEQRQLEIYHENFNK